jgi:hypothetical protein
MPFSDISLNKEQQRQYVLQGAFATLLVTTVVLVALSVS